jgi:hypothetical protein
MGRQVHLLGSTSDDLPPSSHRRISLLRPALHDRRDLHSRRSALPFHPLPFPHLPCGDDGGESPFLLMSFPSTRFLSLPPFTYVFPFSASLSFRSSGFRRTSGPREAQGVLNVPSERDHPRPDNHRLSDLHRSARDLLHLHLLRAFSRLPSWTCRTSLICLSCIR